MASFPRIVVSVASGALALAAVVGCSTTEPGRPAAAVSAAVQTPVATLPMPDLAGDALFRAAHDSHLAALAAELESAESADDAMSAAECEELVFASSLSNAELGPRLRALGCDEQADGLLVGSAGPEELLPDGTPVYLCDGNPRASPWCTDGMTDEQYAEVYGDEYYPEYVPTEEDYQRVSETGGGYTPGTSEYETCVVDPYNPICAS